jgi:NADPH:quinone reductase-like Zn-dependent oxidoreductase
MFTGPYGVSENGAFSEWVAVKREHLCLVPQNIDDAAAGLSVAYLTALIRCARQDSGLEKPFSRRPSEVRWVTQ